MTGSLVLITSYPKSGNTWVRLFLESLLRGPISINDVAIGVYGFQRRWLFDSYAPAHAAEMPPDQLENCLPDVFAELAHDATGPVFVKVHDYARRVPDGRWLFPPELVKAVIYLTRHPFDVAVSYAHHRGIAVAEAVADLCSDDHIIADSAHRLVLPLLERPGSWARNVGSWLGPTPYHVTHVRYEDLCARPDAEFRRLVTAAGIAVSDNAFGLARAATTFANLKTQEEALGFREKPRTSPAFFREGRAGAWRGQLDKSAQAVLVGELGEAMARLGYAGNGFPNPE